MKIKELRLISEQERKSRLEELRNELMKLNSGASVSSSKNSGKVKQIKKTVARILTLDNESRKPRGGGTKA